MPATKAYPQCERDLTTVLQTRGTKGVNFCWYRRLTNVGITPFAVSIVIGEAKFPTNQANWLDVFDGSSYGDGKAYVFVRNGKFGLP